MTITMIIELLIVLLALWVGSRYGSLALGAISGIGLALLVFGFGLKPGSPPTDVIYIIIAAVTCAGILQASGGMDWLIQVAERLLRKHPDRITFLAPLCMFFLTVLVGTGHVVYTLMPIICDIAIKKRHPARASLRCGQCCFTSGHHVFTYRCGRGGIRYDFECLSFRCHHTASADGDNPRLPMRIDGSSGRFLSSRIGFG